VANGSFVRIAAIERIKMLRNCFKVRFGGSCGAATQGCANVRCGP